MTHTKEYLENTILHLENQRNACKSFGIDYPASGYSALVSIINNDIRHFKGMLKDCEGEI